jgi:hypothetical protein
MKINEPSSTYIKQDKRARTEYQNCPSEKRPKATSALQAQSLDASSTVDLWAHRSGSDHFGHRVTNVCGVRCLEVSETPFIEEPGPLRKLSKVNVWSRGLAPMVSEALLLTKPAFHNLSALWTQVYVAFDKVIDT